MQADKTPLHAFVLANVAMRTGRNEKAIIWIENAPKSKAFHPFPYLDYMLGVAKLRRLDTDGRKHLQLFLERTKGRHFIKEAYQKLAWADLLDGNISAYHRNMKLVLTKGVSSSGGDKNAKQEARDGLIPNIHLLKARLLFDGGYYDRANLFLASFNQSDFLLFVHQIEFNYRKGRVLHGLKNYSEALIQYDKTIALGRNHEAFYACNAALQAGLIEERKGQKNNAKNYFDLCLDLKPEDYSTGLHQQAKAGLLRIEKK